MSLPEMLNNLKEALPGAIIDEIVFLEESTIEVRKENLKKVLKYLQEAGYEMFIDLTGVDYLEPTKRTKVVYLIKNPSTWEQVRITVYAGRDETLPSITKLWRGAEWYERELFDMFGVKFEDHPDMKRILMPDDWVGHPLLRDYPLTEEPVEFKHGVKPKVPSEIIPFFKGGQKRNLTGQYVKRDAIS